MEEIKTEKETKHIHSVGKRKRLEIVFLAAIIASMSTICGFSESSTVTSSEVSSSQVSSELVTSQASSALNAVDESQVPTAAASALNSAVSGVPAESSAVTSSESSSSQSSEVPAPSQYTYDKDGLKVTATLSNPADIPAGAELSASRITKENDPERYAKYLAMLQENTGVKTDLPFAAYDISFLLNGQKIEPANGGVAVTLQDTAAQVKPTQDSKVFHVVEEESPAPKLQEVPVNENATLGSESVAFKADSFSTYVVLPTGTYVTNIPLIYKQIKSETDTFTHTSYYNAGSALGIAGSFHIVAFDKATLNSHTNGNILAGTLETGGRNFGTNNLPDELSYVQNYVGTVSANSASFTAHVLAVGSGIAVGLNSYENADKYFTINGTTLYAPYKVWQDENTNTLPFINLDTVYRQVVSASQSLAAMKRNVNITDSLSTVGDPNYSFITMDPNAIGVYNTTAEALSQYQYFGIKGCEPGGTGTLIINVDCTNYPRTSTLTLPVCKKYVNGEWKECNQEITQFVNGRVIWNFIGCKATIETQVMDASLLAPDATIIVKHNINGSIIAKNVTIFSGESHRDDFIGKLPIVVTANKVWLDNAGNPINGSTVTDKTVTLQLYRSLNNGTPQAVPGTPTVTLNKDNGWTYSWVNLLPGYQYSVIETSVTKNGINVSGNYMVTYSSTSMLNSTDINVSNQYVYILPATGGIGTEPFVLSGLLLMVGALCAYMRFGRFRKGSISPNSG